MLEEKLLGPVQLQLTGMVLVVVAVSVNAVPVHTGVFDPTTGVAGVCSTTALTLPADDVQPLIVTVTL